MKSINAVILAFALALTVQGSSATTVKVTVNNETFIVGDTVELLLEVTPNNTAGVGGQFILYERVNNTYEYVKKFMARPSPYQCASCTRTPGSPLREPYKRLFYFIPTKPGFYNAEANFEGTADSKNFTVYASTTTTIVTTTTTTIPELYYSCSDGGKPPITTSIDSEGFTKLRVRDHGLFDGGYNSGIDLTEDDISTSGFEKHKIEIGFYAPEDMGDRAWIFMRAGTEDGRRGETNFTVNGIVVGSCNISGASTGGVLGRWGGCDAQLDTNLLTPGEVNVLTVVNNVVPDMFKLSFIDYDFMEFNCIPSGNYNLTINRTAYRCNNPDDADTYFRKAQESFISMQYSATVMYARVARECYEKANNSKGMENCDILVSQIEESHCSRLWKDLADNYYESAVNEYGLGNFEKTLTFLNRAKKSYSECGDANERAEFENRYRNMMRYLKNDSTQSTTTSETSASTEVTQITSTTVPESNGKEDKTIYLVILALGVVAFITVMKRLK